MSKILIKNILRENLNQADKIYFKSGKLSEKARQIILMITNGDPYTKLVTDIYYDELIQGHKTGQWAIKTLDDKHVETDKPDSDILDNNSLKDLQALYQDLVSYNKNVFPISGFNINGVENVGYFVAALKQRRLILNMFKELPSIASRNMKADIRQERTYPELQSYRSDLEYFMAFYSQLGNRDEAAKSKIEAKMFKNGITLDQLLNFAEEKENLVGGTRFTRNKIKEIVKEDGYDLEIVYDKNNIMIVEVSGPEGIKKIGCNSLWCFTYGNGFNSAYRHWNNYSTNGLVYVIIDFKESPDSKDFMHVLIKPLRDEYDDKEMENPTTLFDMSNEAQYNTNLVIKNFLDFETAKRIMNFGEEVPKPINEPQKTEPYKDPNQMSLFEIKKILRENLLSYSVLDEDYPSSFDMEHFKQLKSFSQRVKYCQDNLKRISSGSSRIVYQVDETKVLKLARNQKGIAQCEVEVQWGNDGYFGGILAKTFESHPNDLWVEMELARKVGKKDFINLVGCTIDEMLYYLIYNGELNNGQRPSVSLDQELNDRLSENEFVTSIFDFMLQLRCPAGDFGKLSSYGIVDRDGEKTIVLIDFGLNNNVYQTYYS